MTETILPPSASDFQRALEATISERLNVPFPIRDVWSARDCPERFLPWLAWGVSIDEWGTDWPEALKRSLIADAIPIQRRKGTAKSVRDVVASFGGSVAIREWWQTTPKGAPYTFSLVISLGQAGIPITAEFVDQVIAEVRRTKPARSHFTFTQALSARGDIGLCAVARPAVYARLRCGATEAPAIALSTFSDGATFADGAKFSQEVRYSG